MTIFGAWVGRPEMQRVVGASEPILISFWKLFQSFPSQIAHKFYNGGSLERQERNEKTEELKN